MAVSYKKLWKLLIDKDMKKKELEEQAKNGFRYCCVGLWLMMR
jgi:hypothetical protein